MASAKLIKKRIASIKSTRKITRTMEMVATAKSRRLINRIQDAQPYREILLNLMGELQQEESSAQSPYLRHFAKPRRVALLSVSANRGLCGEYNSNALRLTRKRYNEWRKKGAECDLFVIGKKGKSYFQNLELPIKESFLHVDDSLSYEQSQQFSKRFMHDFTSGRYEKVEVISTAYLSAGRQEIALSPLLPTDPFALSKGRYGSSRTDRKQMKSDSTKNDPTKNDSTQEREASEKPPADYQPNYIYEPDANTLLNQMIPLVVHVALYGMLLEAMASEQLCRRVAMKNSTEAAGEMINRLTRRYNHIRQATITREISEIVAGADAL